jgi:hypothetical protein
VSPTCCSATLSETLLISKSGRSVSARLGMKTWSACLRPARTEGPGHAGLPGVRVLPPNVPVQSGDSRQEPPQRNCAEAVDVPGLLQLRWRAVGAR